MDSRYYHSKESVKEYIDLAKDVDGRQNIEKLKKFLPQKPSILELGSGPGTDWEILSKQYNVIGSDNSIEFLNHLRNKYPQGEFFELDAISREINQKFDVIYSNKVLHHLSDEELELSINNQLNVLLPNGIVCHSFWKGEDSEIFKGLFVNYHSQEKIQKLFQVHFNVLLIDDYKEFEFDDSILIVAQRK